MLKKHIETVHVGKKPIRCDICDAKFTEKSTLKYHIKSIHEILSILMPPRKFFIGKVVLLGSFTNNPNLRKHILMLHKNALLRCNECNEGFAFSKDLKTHKANEHELKNKTLKCSFWKDRFSNVLANKKHISTAHEGSAVPEMFHQCQICDFKTKSIGCIKTHIQTIHEEKPHHCIFCDARFALRSNFKAHVAVVHEGKKSKKCHISNVTSAINRFQQINYWTLILKNNKLICKRKILLFWSPKIH